MNPHEPAHLLLLLLSGPLVAQTPDLRVQATTVPGQPLLSTLAGRANAPFATFLDVNGGPAQVLGETCWIGFTPLFFLLESGQLSSLGSHAVLIPTPPGYALSLVPFYFQSLVFDATGQNGLFRASNGASAVILGPGNALVQDFADPVAAGFSGNFDTAVRGRLAGGGVRVRSVNAMDPTGTPFNQGVLGPLGPGGVRFQMVYRNRDLQATGDEELVTALRWKVFGGQVVTETWPRVRIELSHSLVQPDFTIDPFTLLPLYPNSGLGLVFAQNVKPGEFPFTLSDGAYALRQQDLRADGYLPFSTPQSFPYNGRDSLLIDIRTWPAPANGSNGGQVNLMVLSSAQPNARVRAAGTVNQPVDPGLLTQATSGDNAMLDLQVELTRIKTTATSPFLVSPVPVPNYSNAVVAATVPPGCAYGIDNRGARDGQGGNATAWSASADIADGMPYLQYRIALTANRATGAVPSLDTLVLPVQ